ncbi:MAG: hypothetical protein IJ493_04270 [Clostridia bacterium]|nr:hypothetical protein [Clostridia bacterium]
MEANEWKNHMDYLTRLAASKCRSQTDAEDLVSDTVLAALAFEKGGGVIEHPRTWLANTLMHKYNSALRKRYGSPVIVTCDMTVEPEDEEDIFATFYATDEAAEVRREVSYLAQINRETLIRYYYRDECVADIARALGIPEGTVKSRLDAGRRQVRKGLETMETRENYLPGKLYISFGGQGGRRGEPTSLVEDDLIAQNLLILAYDKPLTAEELARKIGIPTVYLEPILGRLVDGELMVRTDSKRYYTDFVIYKPEDKFSRFDAQLAFAKEHFDAFWEVMADIIGRLHQLDFCRELRPRQMKKLERYATMRALQNFEYDGCEELKKTLYQYPPRRDGGHWIAHGNVEPADFKDSEQMRRYNNYVIRGGHRSTRCLGYHGTKQLSLFEFDVPMWDSPHRFACCYDVYFDHIHKLLYSTYIGETPECPDKLIECIPQLEELGLFTHIDGKLTVDIPVFTSEEYAQIAKICADATARLIASLGGAYVMHLRGMGLNLPPHLKSVPEFFRYLPATWCIVMSVVREAYERGLHLSELDYCCPPVVLVVEK